MAILRFKPLRHWMSLQDEMNRLFRNVDDDFYGEREDAVWAPRVDISETPDDLIVRCELPGVSAEDIDVDINNNTLTIRGEKKQEELTDSENYYRVERVYGRFSRSFSLPQRVEGDAVSARYKDGILLITIPKAEEAKPRKIQIEAE